MAESLETLCRHRLFQRLFPTQITEVPEFCGAEHLLASRAKDVENLGRTVNRMVGWYKEYASQR